jgi:hypothetical protein
MKKIIFALSVFSLLLSCTDQQMNSEETTTKEEKKC